MHAVSNAGLLYADAEETGAFTKVGSSRISPSGTNVAGNHLGFDSSRVSPIYGKTETVQPSSIRALACIKA